MRRAIGYISYTHGLKGNVKIVPMIDDFAEIIDELDGQVLLKNDDILTINIKSFDGKVFLCGIDGVENIDEAKKFTKQEIFADFEDDDGYIDAEKLIGFDVFDKNNGEKYGNVVDCGNYGDGMLIEVKLLKSKVGMKSEFYKCNTDNIFDINYEAKTLSIKPYDDD